MSRVPKNPTTDEYMDAFARIAELLDGEFDPRGEEDTHDGALREASRIAAKFASRLQRIKNASEGV